MLDFVSKMLAPLFWTSDPEPLDVEEDINLSPIEKPLTEDGAEIVSGPTYYFASHSSYGIFEVTFDKDLNEIWSTMEHLLWQCSEGNRPIYYGSLFLNKEKAEKKLVKMINEEIQDLNQSIQKYRPEFVLGRLEEQ